MSWFWLLGGKRQSNHWINSIVDHRLWRRVYAESSVSACAIGAPRRLLKREELIGNRSRTTPEHYGQIDDEPNGKCEDPDGNEDRQQKPTQRPKVRVSRNRGWARFATRSWKRTIVRNQQKSGGVDDREDKRNSDEPSHAKMFMPERIAV
jgi:hypothetical protein